MRFAPIVSYHPSLSGPAPVSWPSSLRIAATAGFDAIDLVIPEVVKLDAARIRNDLDRAAVAAGPASLPIEFRRDETTFREGIERLPRLAQVASEVGTRTMYRSIPASSDVPAPELRRILRRRIAEIARILDVSGIAFAVEVLGPLHRRREGRYEFIWRLGDAADLIEACPPNVGLLADAWHWHHARESVDDLLAVGPLIRHVHVADGLACPPDRVRDDERVLPGEGTLNLRAFAGALATIGYADFVSPEISGYRCPDVPLVCARRAVEATRSALAA